MNKKKKQKNNGKKAKILIVDDHSIVRKGLIQLINEEPDLTEKIKYQRPQLPVLILTMHDEALYAKRAFQAGAGGYITKQEAAETIITAIRLMLSGKDYISETMTQKFLKKLHSRGSHC